MNKYELSFVNTILNLRVILTISIYVMYKFNLYQIVYRCNTKKSFTANIIILTIKLYAYI